MKSSVIIPTAMQICVDDLGWFTGTDARHIGRPSRTGMTRPHCPEDYTVLNEIGKAIGQKIMCPLVLGEWDKENILRGEIGVTYEPETWDRASVINLKLAERCFEEAEKSEFIEYAVHGVLHGNYAADGSQITEQEYFEYKAPGDKLLSTQSQEEIEHRFELFFKLYDMWGFKKKIRAFACPNSIPINLESKDLGALSAVLKKHGIEYWANGWKKIKGYTEFIDGILYMEKASDIKIPWNAYDVDPAYIADFAKEGDEQLGIIINSHWPNYLRFNPEHNLERVKDWADYFKRQSEIFGLMVSKDIAFAGNQCVYRTYSTVEVNDKKIKIDVSNALSKTDKHVFGAFYISLKNDLVPEKVDGGTLEVYETHKNFKTYKLTHTSTIIEITVK